MMREFGWSASESIDTSSMLSLAITTSSGFAAQLTVKSAKAGGPVNSAAIADESATIIAPVVCKTVAEFEDGAGGIMYGSIGPHVLDLRGSIILSPGYAIVTDVTLDTSAVMGFHFMWEEVDAA